MSECKQWGQALDEHKGAVYYYNKATGETTWEKPGGSGGQAAAAAEADAAAGGALATLKSSAESGDALFHVKDTNAWESRGIPAPTHAPPASSASAAHGARHGARLSYNPTAGGGRSDMGGWAKRIVDSGS
jgi:hypothetical protein